MKTVIMITILFFLTGCGGATPSESSTTPPQPNATIDMAPPASPTLE